MDEHKSQMLYPDAVDADLIHQNQNGLKAKILSLSIRLCLALALS